MIRHTVMFTPKHLPGFVAIRVVSWILALGALLIVVFGYTYLPDDLPVSRWHSAPKTWPLVVRVPLINLFSLGLIEVLGRSLSRYDGDLTTKWITPVLLATAGAKAIIESIEMLPFLDGSPVFVILLVTTVAAGIASALWCGKHLLSNKQWKKLTMTTMEKLVTATLITAIFILNLPVLFADSLP